MPPTESKVVIDPQGTAKVMHRTAVRGGHSLLCIIAAPQHDHHSAPLQDTILAMAAQRGGDFVRLSDVADAMKGVNRALVQAGAQACAGAPDGVSAAIVHRGAEAWKATRRPEPNQQQLDVTVAGRPTQLHFKAYGAEQCRYAARAAAYLWNDLQALPTAQQQAIAGELAKREWERSHSDRLAREAIARVQREEGFRDNPGITTCLLPPAQSKQQARARSSRARR